VLSAPLEAYITDIQPGAVAATPAPVEVSSSEDSSSSSDSDSSDDESTVSRARLHRRITAS